MDIKTLGDTPPWEWPEDAGATFLDVLTDREVGEDDRVLAAEMAGNCCAVNDELVAALLEVLGSADESDALRGRAAISLGPALDEADTYGFQDAEDVENVPVSEEMFGRINDTLRALFQEDTVPRDVRRRILEASVRAPQEWHAEAIREAYASSDETWKLTAVFCMKYVAGFDDEIMAALSGDADPIRYEALLAAGNRELKAAWPHVAAILEADHPDKDLLLAAIDAAATIRPEEAVDTLERFACHADGDVVDAAFMALAMTGHDGDDLDFDSDEDDDEDDEEDDGEQDKGRKFPPHMLS